MEILRTIKDADIGSAYAVPMNYLERKAARAVVFDTEGKIALFHSTKKHYHKLPGGGIEEDESIETALRRELLEEIGCEVDTIRELGVIEEYRNRYELHQFSYCFIANLKGEKGVSHLDEGEIAEGFITEWIDLESAIKILENEKEVEDYQGKFIQMRDLIFLKAAREKILK
jgi:8-oxo-dGTP diphosphatase